MLFHDKISEKEKAGKRNRAQRAKPVEQTLCLALSFCYGIGPAVAGTGLDLDHVVAGEVAIDGIESNHTQINQTSESAIIDWRGFSIDSDEAVNFNQPSSASLVLNRVTGANESQILGQLSADGQVFLINPNGILFGNSSQVDVAGLLATTSDISNEDFLAGRYQFSSNGDTSASVVNQGSISIRDGGLVALVAPGVENSGVIVANYGRVSLAAGDEFTLDLYGDQLIQLALDSSLAGAAADSFDPSVENSGAIYANGGTVMLDSRTASAVVNDVINMSGVIQAQSIEQVDGQIILTAGSRGTIEIDGTLDASGDLASQYGGTIEVLANSIQVSNNSNLDVSGSEAGGHIELSGKTVNVDALIDLNGGNGAGGTLLIDPLDLVIDSTSGTDVVTVGTIESALASGGDFIAEAEQSISVNAAIDTSAQATGGTLSLNDENNDGNLTINLNAGITLGSNQTLQGQGSLVNVAGPSIQNGVDVAAANASVSIAAGSYNESVVLDVEGLTLSGQPGAILNVDTGATGFTISGADTTLTGMTITGPFSEDFTETDWDTAGNAFAVVVNSNVLGVAITDNDISDIRTGISLSVGSEVNVSGNSIDNTKGSILVRTDDATINDNQTGAIGSEWDIVLFDVSESAYTASPNTDEVQYGADIMALSSDNGDMRVLDRRYGAGGFLGDTPEYGNRSHIEVQADSTFTAADDFGLGNGLGSLSQPIASINDAVDGVVYGGIISVQAGDYSEDVVIDKALTLYGIQAGIDARDRAATESTITGNISIENAANDVLIDGFTIAEGSSGGGENAGITIKSAVTDTVIQNTIFSRSGVIDGDTYRGIVTYSGGNQSGLVIQNNSFSGWATGVFLNPSASGAQILNNDFDGNYVGVSVDGTDGTLISGNLFANNLFEGLGIGPGEDTPTMLLTNNEFSNNTTHIGLYADMQVDASANSFESVNTADMTIEQIFSLVEQIGDGTNSATGYSGLVSLRDGFVFVIDGRDINDAIDLATAGDTVSVAAGSYSDAISIDKSITLSAMDGAQISLDGSGALSRIINIVADNVTVDGFSIDGGGNHVGIAIPGQNATVSNNQISNVITGIQTNTLNTEGNNSITNNSIADAGYGISLQNNSNTVTGNSIDVSTEGMGIGSANNIITGNTFEISSDGVQIQTYRTEDYAALPGADIDLLEALANNEFNRATYLTNDSSGSSDLIVQTIFGSIEGALDSASDGNTLMVTDGLYELDGTLTIDQSIALVGESESGTIIDASAASSYGIYVTADDVSLSNFTTQNAGTYGIKVSPSGDASSRVTNFSISNVSIENSGRTELDFNGVLGASIDNVTANGMDSAGVGIAIGDSAEVSVTNSSTSGNAWGGLALYQNNTYYDQQTRDISIDASNSFSESNALYLEDESASNDFAELSILGFDFAVRNADGRGIGGDGDEFIWLQQAQQQAIDYAMLLENPESGYIEGWNGTASNGIFSVGTSTDGDAMSISSAIAAASTGDSINILAGSYDEDLILSGEQAFSFDGATILSLSSLNGATLELGGSLNLASLSIADALSLIDDLSITASENIDINTVDGAFDLSMTASSANLDNVGGTDALASLSITANNMALGNINTTGAQSYEGALALNGSNYNGSSINIIGATQLNTDVSLATTGAISFSDVINGAFDLSLTASSVDLDNIGNATALDSLDIIAASIAIGDVNSTGGQRYEGALTLNGSNYNASVWELIGTSLLSTDVSIDTSTSNGNVSFSDDIDGTVAEQQDLSIDSGTGSVTHVNIGQTVALGTLNINSGNYDGSAGTTDLVNLNVNADDISVGNNTVNARSTVALIGRSVRGSINANQVEVIAEETVSINVVATETASVSAKNVESSSISAETVAIEASENVEANITATASVEVQAQSVSNTSIDANEVIVSASQDVDAQISAVTQITVDANNISGSISAPSADIEAQQNIDVVADVETLTVASEGEASISGSVGSIEITSGTVDINGTSEAALSTGVVAPENLLTLVLFESENSPNPASTAFSEGAIGDLFTTDFELGSVELTTTNKVNPEEDEDESSEENANSEDETETDEQLKRFLKGSWSDLAKQAAN